MPLSGTDLAVLGISAAVGGLYVFRGAILGSGTKTPTLATRPGTSTEEFGNPRDFIAKMKAQKKRVVIFYGSQTGTAEEYAIRLAKEAKSRFGLGSLVCDPEEYDFENFDELPEDCCAFFVVATYGEGEPTDNAVQMMQNLSDDSFMFSKEEHRLEGLKYVVFGLGNRTYEHYNEIARIVDRQLEGMGAVRIGERGEGDDDKSMEEDYLEWKDGMWAAFSAAMGVEEGAGAESPDFVVNELTTVDMSKVYLGELSARALTKTKGIHDLKNPYPAPIAASKELFAHGGERNCIHIEFDTSGSGITYQHGDHVGVWPSNADVEVNRLLFALGLGPEDRRKQAIGVESLDPALAKVPFPVPTTYETAVRHYIDISSIASRQMLGALAKYAPSEESATFISKLGKDKDYYNEVVHKGCLKLGEVLQLCAGNDIHAAPSAENTTAWKIPFDVIISAIPRLQPRYYSISSSPKLHPTLIHVTCVVLKYQNVPVDASHQKWVFGVGSNYILNLKMAAHNESAPLMSEEGESAVHVTNPSYAIAGPRSAYASGELYKAPIHVRRSTFRLPTNPKSPVIMIGPGTGVAPFRGFVQERVALSRKAIEKNGADALKEWGQMYLYYGCRSETDDYLYRDEWPGYQAELKEKLNMRVAFSRSGPRKPDGSKIYVQDLLWEDRVAISDAILNQKAYIYICGDGKSMSKSVEDALARILAEGKSVSVEDGAKEVKTLKERSRLMMDVWS